LALEVTLMKWAAVSLDDAEFVCMLYLDMDILTPAHLARQPAVAAEWLSVLASMRSYGVDLAASPDHSSPINAGFMLIRPNRSLYDEGVALLSRGSVAFNRTHGWEPMLFTPISMTGHDRRYPAFTGHWPSITSH
jgi:hypothetical protein